ncbi:MAG: hypothetical protein JWO86_1566 [Myxococcaceae bacterium]|jgi:hypothetical protein|nr:hypothetical protein [Myxococcaceae bacterium]MEA2748571.1 hypothetical protein [Myxococcales bacterium]
MHQVRSMSRRSHRSLRLGALALLAAMAVWPRASTNPARAGANAVELGAAARAAATTHSVAARAETTAAKLVSPPRTAKLSVAQNDESQLTN